MNPQATGAAYDQIAEKWQSADFNNENGVALHRRALEFLDEAARPGGRALDVGCGCNGRFHRLLSEQGMQVEGLDVSARMIALARTRDPDMILHHADICSWQPPHDYDFITAWDSIWHLPLASQQPVMSKLVKMLRPGGVLIFSAGGVDEAGEHSNSVMGPKVHYSTLGTAGLLSLIDACGCAVGHLEFDQWPEKHLVIIVLKPAESSA